MMRLKNYKKFIESIGDPNDMWDYIPESIKEIHQLFKDNGKKLFVVGGSVRDFLNNERPKDFDLATDALPEEVVKIIGDRWRVTLQGKSFFVVVVYTEDEPKGMEIATFRSDDYGDLLGKTRNPNVKYSTIEEDSARRDISWNALYYDLDKREILDLSGGMEDMKNKITRFIGDPDMRIKEDPLRILRCVRFSSRYNFRIEDKTSDSIRRNKSQLSIITKPRIWEEIHKAYKQCKDFKKYLDIITDLELWEQVFPKSIINTNVIKCGSLEVYFANLFKDESVKTLQRKLVQTYVIPDDISRVVAFLVWFQSFLPENILEFYDKKKSYKISNDMIIEWIKVANLTDPKYTTFTKFDRSVSSEELMARGLFDRELGLEIKRQEIENFRKLLNG